MTNLALRKGARVTGESAGDGLNRHRGTVADRSSCPSHPGCTPGSELVCGAAARLRSVRVGYTVPVRHRRTSQATEPNRAPRETAFAAAPAAWVACSLAWPTA